MARLVRMSWGGLLLLVPRQVLALCSGDQSRPVVTAARILGARHVAESVVLAAGHGNRPPRWMVAVDVVHGLSMLFLAAVSPRLRRDCLASAAAAGALVALSVQER